MFFLLLFSAFVYADYLETDGSEFIEVEKYEPPKIKLDAGVTNQWSYGLQKRSQGIKFIGWETTAMSLDEVLNRPIVDVFFTNAPLRSGQSFAICVDLVRHPYMRPLSTNGFYALSFGGTKYRDYRGAQFVVADDPVMSRLNEFIDTSNKPMLPGYQYMLKRIDNKSVSDNNPYAKFRLPENMMAGERYKVVLDISKIFDFEDSLKRKMNAVIKGKITTRLPKINDDWCIRYYDSSKRGCGMSQVNSGTFTIPERALENGRLRMAILTPMGAAGSAQMVVRNLKVNGDIELPKDAAIVADKKSMIKFKVKLPDELFGDQPRSENLLAGLALEKSQLGLSLPMALAKIYKGVIAKERSLSFSFVPGEYYVVVNPLADGRIGMMKISLKAEDDGRTFVFRDFESVELSELPETVE
jgi:hypothetical protein